MTHLDYAVQRMLVLFFSERMSAEEAESYAKEKFSEGRALFTEAEGDRESLHRAAVTLKKWSRTV